MAGYGGRVWRQGLAAARGRDKNSEAGKLFLPAFCINRHDRSSFVSSLACTLIRLLSCGSTDYPPFFLRPASPLISPQYPNTPGFGPFAPDRRIQRSVVPGFLSGEDKIGVSSSSSVIPAMAWHFICSGGRAIRSKAFSMRSAKIFVPGLR